MLPADDPMFFENVAEWNCKMRRQKMRKYSFDRVPNLVNWGHMYDLVKDLKISLHLKLHYEILQVQDNHMVHRSEARIRFAEA